MSEGIMCIRNKCTSDYKAKVLITIFQLNNFSKRDINDVEEKKEQLISGKPDVLVCSLFCE